MLMQHSEELIYSWQNHYEHTTHDDTISVRIRYTYDRDGNIDVVSVNLLEVGGIMPTGDRGSHGYPPVLEAIWTEFMRLVPMEDYLADAIGFREYMARVADEAESLHREAMAEVV